MPIVVKSKEQRVNEEIERLASIFQGIDENQKAFVREEIRSLAWYSITCADLRESIDRDGTTIEYQNGKNQSGMQANPDCRLLVDFQKHMNTLTKELINLVPVKVPDFGKLNDFILDTDNI